jgi:hypothetical protein
MLARAWLAAKMVPAVLAWFVYAVLLVGAGASAGMDSDDRIRSIKVGNEPLSADKVIMVGGGAVAGAILGGLFALKLLHSHGHQDRAAA